MYAEILQTAFATWLTSHLHIYIYTLEMATYVFLLTNHKTYHRQELPQKVLSTTAQNRCFLSSTTSKFKNIVTLWILEIPWQLSWGLVQKQVTTSSNHGEPSCTASSNYGSHWGLNCMALSLFLPPSKACPTLIRHAAVIWPLTWTVSTQSGFIQRNKKGKIA